MSKPTIVLVHGAFADASCWQKVIPLLHHAGFRVATTQNPLRSLADDIITTQRVIEAQAGDVVLVGHSYGGAVISGAAADKPKVKALVYVAAFAPDAGESLGGLGAQFPAPPLATALVPDSAGFLSIDPAKYREVFAADLSEAECAVLAVTQKPIASAIFGEPLAKAAWHTVPSWFAVSKQDKAIPPDLERFVAKRMKATVTELDASHVSFLSQPDQIARIIQEAAASLG